MRCKVCIKQNKKLMCCSWLLNSDLVETRLRRTALNSHYGMRRWFDPKWGMNFRPIYGISVNPTNSMTCRIRRFNVIPILSRIKTIPRIDTITRTILGERHKQWSSSLWSPLHSQFASLLGPNIHLRVLFWCTSSILRNCCNCNPSL